MEGIEALKEQILAESERLGLEDIFSFRCHQTLSCFNVCCGDVNIFLTPYDILRLKKRLGISSTEFLHRYTIKPFTKEQKLPVVMLRMDESKENKPCHFVTEEGCSVYDDRPWPCRMYPVGAASARTENDPEAPEFYFLMKEKPCDGFVEGHTWTIRQWMENQGVGPYNDVGDLFKEITLHPRLRQITLNPFQMDMFYMACYDLDRFRRFVFESSFLNKYDVAVDEIEAMRDTDEALLKFGFKWLKTCLFNENTVKLKAATRVQYTDRLKEQGMKVHP